VNEQNRKQIIFLAVAGVALVGVLVYQFGFAGGTTPETGGEQPGAAATAAAPVTGQTRPAQPARARTGAEPAGSGTAAAALYEPLDPAALDSLIARIQRVQFRYPENPGRDPMEPLIREGSSRFAEGMPVLSGSGTYVDLQDKKVTGIIGNDQSRYAVVDDEVVYPGYRYPNGVWVDSIERDKVIFGFEDKRIPVPLKE